LSSIERGDPREGAAAGGRHQNADLGDNDVNFVGQSSAYLLACRLVDLGVSAVPTIPDMIPGEAKTDWNNVLQHRSAIDLHSEQRSAACIDP
jgi:hypothetical protein